jgi:hypothetical protein
MELRARMDQVAPAPSLARRVLASASLSTVAVWLANEARWEGAFLGIAAVVAAGSIALGRRSVLSQVLGRGVAWCALAPAALATVDGLAFGRLPSAVLCLFVAAPSAALLLARPALHTAEARAEFGPLRYRRLFLAGTVASMAAAVSAGIFAMAGFGWGEAHPVTLSGAIVAALALFASAVGVVRMRAWGVLLAIVTSAASFAGALLSRGQWLSAAFWVTAMPGLLLALPVLFARLRAPGDHALGAARAPAPAPQAHFRIASVASSEGAAVTDTSLEGLAATEAEDWTRELEEAPARAR